MMMIIIICSKTSSAPHACTHGGIVSLEESLNSEFMATVSRLNGHQVRLITRCQQCSIYARLPLATVASLDTGQHQEGRGMIIGDMEIPPTQVLEAGVVW